jgi:hypothetical protein
MSLAVIDNLIDNKIAENKDVLFRETIQKIHPELHTYQNSISILVGKQGMGKSYTALKEIIKISFVDPCTHMLIIINKDGSSNDATYESLKSLIRIPVNFYSYVDAENRVKQILKYKEFYNTVKKNQLEDQIADDQAEETFGVLEINDFSRPYLHTIIYFEDCANNICFRRSVQYFPQLIATCRHNGISFFFTTQFWKGVPTELKSNATTIYIFRDFSKQQITYILQQTPLKHDLNVVYRNYKNLNNHDRMVVDTVTGKIIIDKT